MTPNISNTPHIVERLKATRAAREVSTIGNGLCYADSDHQVLINPDGPEAAAVITAYEAALKEIADGSVFNQQRFAEDSDADYFLRCFSSIKECARTALTVQETVRA